MGVFDNLTGLFESGDSESAYQYHCTDCESKFISHESDISTAECPDCGGQHLHK